MSPDRATEILMMPSTKMPGHRLIEVGSIRPHITAEEDNFVLAKWETMPGHTSYFNALQRIANGD